MEEIIKFELTRDEAAGLSEALEHCLKTLDESNERSKQTHADIERLQAETRVLLNHLGALFNVEAIV